MREHSENVDELGQMIVSKVQLVPGITRIEMSRLAWTGPKALEMPRASSSGGVPSDAGTGRSNRAA